MKLFPNELRAACFTARAIKAFVTMKTAHADYLKTYQKAVARMGTGATLGFLGARGTGKTVMATSLANAVLEKDMKAPVLYVTAHQMFMAFKSTYNKNSDSTELDIYDSFRKPILLVIDEIGRRQESDWENRMLIDLCDARYGDLKDTILISNQEKSVFDDAIGDSIVSRMTEGGGCLLFDWPTFRGA